MVAKPINHANAVSCPAHLIFCPVGHQGPASFITAIRGQAAVAPYASCTIRACAAVCPVIARNEPGKGNPGLSTTSEPVQRFSR